MISAWRLERTPPGRPVSVLYQSRKCRHFGLYVWLKTTVLAPSNRDTPLTNNSVLTRGVSFGEKDHRMHSWYLIPRIYVLSRGAFSESPLREGPLYVTILVALVKTASCRYAGSEKYLVLLCCLTRRRCRTICFGLLDNFKCISNDVPWLYLLLMDINLSSCYLMIAEFLCRLN